MAPNAAFPPISEYVIFTASRKQPSDPPPSPQGPVLRKPISADLGLNVVQGVSCLNALPLLILCDNLKAADVTLLNEKNVLKSTLSWIKSELKIDANPKLA